MTHPAPAPLPDESPVLPHKRAFAWQSVVGLLWGTLVPTTMMCACGHLDVPSLVGTVPAAALAWWGFACRLGFMGRVVAAGVVVFSTFLSLKNLLDIGWFGHHPLFG